MDEITDFSQIHKKLSINLLALAKADRIFIYFILAKAFSSLNLPPSAKADGNELRLEAKPKGIYFLQVTQGKQVYKKKVLLQ